MNETFDRLITPAETAQLLGISVAALAIMRTRRQGPIYIRLGRRIRYSTEALVAYIAKATVQQFRENADA